MANTGANSMADWFRLDAEFAVHPKVVDLSDEAFRLHVETLGLVARLETDGRIKLRWLSAFMNDDAAFMKVVEELHEARLWDLVNGEWLIHDWSDYNPSHQDLVARRDAASNAASIRWSNAASNAERNAESNARNVTVTEQQQEQYSEDAYALVDRFRDLLKKNDRPVRSTRKSMAHHADLLLRRDKADPAEALAVADWCQEEGNWWQPIVGGMEGFRKNYFTMRDQRRAQTRGRNEPSNDLPRMT